MELVESAGVTTVTTPIDSARSKPATARWRRAADGMEMSHRLLDGLLPELSALPRT